MCQQIQRQIYVFKNLTTTYSDIHGAAANSSQVGLKIESLRDQFKT